MYFTGYLYKKNDKGTCFVSGCLYYIQLVYSVLFCFMRMRECKNIAYFVFVTFTLVL